jgi:hypothetical protein
VVRRDASRDARLPDVGIGVCRVEVVDVAAELILKLCALAPPEEVRLVEADEAADPGALAGRRAKVHVARPLLLHAEDDVHVALVTYGARLGRRHRGLEEVQVRDVLVAAQQVVPVEHLPGRENDLLPDARFVGEVVAFDVNAVDDGRARLLDLPPEIHHAH